MHVATSVDMTNHAHGIVAYLRQALLAMSTGSARDAMRTICMAFQEVVGIEEKELRCITACFTMCYIVSIFIHMLFRSMLNV